MGRHLPERPSLALVSRILPALPCAPRDKATFSQTIPAGSCALCGVRPPWGQGPHPLVLTRIGWDEGTWERCSETRVVLAGLWDTRTFLFPHYTLYRNLYLCSSHITFIIRKRKPTIKRHTEDALLMWTVVRRSSILTGPGVRAHQCLTGEPQPSCFPPYPSTAFSPCGSGFLVSIRGSAHRPHRVDVRREDPHFWLLILGLSQHFHF